MKEADPPSPLVAAAARYLPARVRSWLVDRSPQIVLLDTGMIVELSPRDQAALLGFFRALTRMDGRGLAAEVINMSVDGACKVRAVVVGGREEVRQARGGAAGTAGRACRGRFKH